METYGDFLATGLEECLDGSGIVVMEWGDKFPEILRDCSLNVAFSILGEQSRELLMPVEHTRAIELLEGLKPGL